MKIYYATADNGFIFQQKKRTESIQTKWSRHRRKPKRNKKCPMWMKQKDEVDIEIESE